MPRTRHNLGRDMIKFENKDNGRYYYMSEYKDILNDWVLTIIRGGITSRVIRHYGYLCRNDLQAEIARLSKRRLQRGYKLVS